MSFICDKNRNIIQVIDLLVKRPGGRRGGNMCAYSGGFGGGRRGGGGGGGYGGRDARRGVEREQRGARPASAAAARAGRRRGTTRPGDAPHLCRRAHPPSVATSRVLTLGCVTIPLLASWLVSSLVGSSTVTSLRGALVIEASPHIITTGIHALGAGRAWMLLAV